MSIYACSLATMLCTMPVVCPKNPVDFLVKESGIKMQILIGNAFGKLADGTGVFARHF